MKKKLLLSIAVNLILLIIYFYFFHFRQSLHSYAHINHSTTMVGESFTRESKWLIKRIKEPLEMRPQLAKILNPYFKDNDEFVDHYSLQINEELKKENISKKEFFQLFKEYQKTSERLQQNYIKTLKESQKEAKLTDSEVERKIKEMIENVFDVFSLNEKSFNNHLSLKRKKYYLNVFLLNIKVKQMYCFYNMAGLVGSRGTRLNKFFPLVYTEKAVIHSHEKFKSKIYIGHLNPHYFDDYTIFWNGEKIEYDHYSSPLSIKESRKKMIDKKYEAVVVWKDRETKEIMSDTSYFQFYSK